MWPWTRNCAHVSLSLKESVSHSVVSTLCDPMDCSPPGSSVHGILQARILEWVAISFSRGSSQPRDRTQVSCIAGRFFTIWATREAERGPLSSSLFHLLAPPCTCPGFSLGSALPLSVPQEADLCSLHHLGSVAGWLPAGFGQWKVRLAGNQVGVGVGEMGVLFLLAPSALLMRTVPVCGHSSPAPALTRWSPLLPRPADTKDMPLLLSPNCSFNPDYLSK